MTKKTSRRDHIAFHEAGHAVVGRVLTLVCKGASIIANHRSYGRSVVAHYEICEKEWTERGKRRGTPRNRQRAALDAAIMTTMAGVQAEVEFFGASLDGSGEADMAQVEEWLFDEPGDWHKRVVRLGAMTRVLVRRHRKRIECVAEALLAKEHLTAKQVDKLAGRSVDDVEPNIPGWEVPV